jgi:NADH-quinone oxidoreductase subunit M
VTAIEWAAWAPLVVLTLVVGLWPRLVLGVTEAPVRALVEVAIR